MAAPDSTKFQINYKLADGTLINLYATDVKELESGLTDLAMVSALIKSTGADLGGKDALAAATAAITQSFPGATPVAAPVAQSGEGKVCRHGAMVWKEGTSAKGPWKAWMCAAPKGAVDKCDAIWVR